MAPRLGIALGTGAARGWAHIGILRGLASIGLRPTALAGTSAGAFVAAAAACGRLEAVETWARGLGTREILRLLDVTLTSGGVLAGEKVLEFLRRNVGDAQIEDLGCRYASVATDLATGREVWLQQGSLVDAVRASMALPGLLTPARQGGRWLVDGGLVNPVPVSLCRAIGADVVIAVDLSTGRFGTDRDIDDREEGGSRELWRALSARLSERLVRRAATERPSVYDVVVGSLHIMQDRITRSRMAGDPPEVLLTPRLDGIRLLDFDSASEAIERGRDCVARQSDRILDSLARFGIEADPSLVEKA